MQLNENSLWTGDEKDTGRYQNLADLMLELNHGEPKNYRRSLDIDRAIHTIDYSSGDTVWHREYFASAPQQVIILRFTADKRGAYNGRLKLVDAHGARTTASARLLTSAGKLDNGLEFETQVEVIHTGGKITAAGDALQIENADDLTIFIAAGTNYLPDRAHAWRGESPHARITRQLAAAAAKPYAGLRAAHVTDYQTFFHRVSLDLGGTAPDLPTDRRLVLYRDGAADPDLEALFFPFGRYLLLSSSRPGSLPANLQGLWNNSNNPPWRSDYHSNINIQMNYWRPKQPTSRNAPFPFSTMSTSLAATSHPSHQAALSQCARLDGADREQYLRRRQF